MFTARATVLAVLLFARSSSAEGAGDADYCDKVRARATGDADLLMSPRVLLQGIRFAQNGQQVDVGPISGDGYQVRAGVSFSPLDFYRGLRVLDMSEAECARHRASTRVGQVIQHGAEAARLAAFRAQAQFLEAHAQDWRALEAKAAARLAQRIITVTDFSSMGQYVDALEHKLVRAAGQARELEALGRPSGDEPLPDMARTYFDESMRLEREASRLRELDAWKFQLTAGLIPQSPVDWFGLAEVTFNVGALAQSSSEARYLDSRAAELRRSQEEVQAQLETFRAQTYATLEEARRDLDVVQRSIDVLGSTRLVLDRSEDASATHARDTLAVEQLSVEADGVFLRALIDALTALSARAHG